MEMRSCNCITKSKRPNTSRHQTPSFVVVWKNKQQIAQHIRHQLHEGKLGDQMTMFGKDDVSFKGGKEKEGPSFTGGKQQTCAEARPSIRLRGRCWHSVALHAHAYPRLRRGAFLCFLMNGSKYIRYSQIYGYTFERILLFIQHSH